jgi:hypothetical protein
MLSDLTAQMDLAGTGAFRHIHGTMAALQSFRFVDP